MSEDRITVGDEVRVSFNNAQMTLSYRATVLYTPAATGDSWIFKDIESGELYYVSEGCTLTKLKPKLKPGDPGYEDLPF